MRKLLTVLAALFFCLSLAGRAADGKGIPFQVGADASADFFLSSSGPINVSGGLGVRTRFGSPDQWLNVIAGLRYIYGARLSGPQIPVLLNVNLLKTSSVSAYICGGYEFDFIGTYWGCTKFQTGVLIGPHTDIQISYKPYQGALGVGFTYYF